MKLPTRAVDALFIQAGIAAALSFSHIHDVAQACGQGPWQAWAYPISVDLLLFAAWRRLRKGEGGAQEWVWFCVALVASLGANLATAGLLSGPPPEWLALIVAGWPALAFLGGTLLVHKRKSPEAAREVPSTQETETSTATEDPDGIVTLPANVVPLSRPVGAAYPVNAFMGEEPEAPREMKEPKEPKKSRKEAAKIIEEGWRHGLSPDEVAKAATRHPVSVRRQYAKLDDLHAAKKDALHAARKEEVSV